MNQEITAPVQSASAIIKADPVSQDSKKDLCSNCGAELTGQFCHFCGQSSKSMIKFFGEVIKELLDDTLGYDSRLKHSLFPLFFKPGRLTLDYVKGKRFHYVLPFKLYLITSVLFILLIKNSTDTENLKFNDVVQDEASQEISKDVEEEINHAIDEVNKANVAQGKKIIDFHLGEEQQKDVADSIAESEADEERQAKNNDRESASDEKENDNTITIGTGDDDVNLNWNEETQQLDGIEDLDDGLIKTFVSRINPKLKSWKNDLEPLVESVIETLPYMMFVILPIFALFLKIFYVFSKRYYTEHLVFLLHNHSFIYMLMMLQIGLGFGDSKLKSVDYWAAQSAADVFSFISFILGFWMVIYVFLAMKRFYRQGWAATIFKTFALGFIYIMMLSFGFVVTIALGAYQA
jgi:hypothetical protein